MRAHRVRAVVLAGDEHRRAGTGTTAADQILAGNVASRFALV